MSPQRQVDRPWTYLELVVALLGIPLATIVFRVAGFTRSDIGPVVIREVSILALVGLLLWIIRSKEQLPLSSIGLKRTPFGVFILWTIAVMVAFAAALLFCLGLLLPSLGLSYGSGGGPAVSMGVTLLIVIRAGVAEEIFYRGFAIERIQMLTSSRTLAGLTPLVMFAAFHFSQGIAGVIIALLVGAVATGFYMWKRNIAVLMAAHFLLDFIPNMLVPLVSKS